MGKTKNSKLIEQFNKLSKRELVLIYIMLVAVILAGGVRFLIMPAMNTHDEVSEQLMEAQQEQQTVELAIAQIPILQNEITEYQKNIKKMKKKFNEVLVNEDIDALVTGMVTSSGLKPVSLQIGVSGEGEEASGSSNTADTVDAGTADGQAVVETNNATVKSTAVTVKAKGTMSQFSSLIGRAKAQKGVAIRSFSLTGQEEDEEKSTADLLSNVLDTQNKKKNIYPYEAELVLEIYQSKSV